MKSILLLISLCFASVSFSQSTVYSYSFSGNIEHINSFEKQLLSIDGVESCKIRFKEEQNKGELIFQLKEYKPTYDENGERVDSMPLVLIQQLLFKEKLTPIELIELNH
jgi:hypothetical protein